MRSSPRSPNYVFFTLKTKFVCRGSSNENLRANFFCNLNTIFVTCNFSIFFQLVRGEVSSTLQLLLFQGSKNKSLEEEKKLRQNVNLKKFLAAIFAFAKSLITISC
jgi:hypothetical protein